MERKIKPKTNHAKAVATSAPATIAWTTIEPALTQRPDMSSHDYLISLLHLGSSLEHALMVQYLYAAYSLGGDQVPQERRSMVQGWQDTILAVAREEMGHLLTVQNILTFFGAGLTLTRARLPWIIQWFDLEPLTLGSLACYVYAEMPERGSFRGKDKIVALARAHLTSKGATNVALRPVGEVYSIIMNLLEDGQTIPDRAFRDETYVLQASWDDWGRGYQPDPRPLDPEGNLENIKLKAHQSDQFRARILIDRVASRTQVLAALKRLSIQGEGEDGPATSKGDNGSEKNQEWSHFERFIKIYREFESIAGESWSPTLPLPTNPNTVEDPTWPDRDGFVQATDSRNWAHLFNLRYRMLLTLLMHTFQVARSVRAGEPNIRAMLMHKVFGEMYNLKAIAGLLMKRPLRDVVDPAAAQRAAPPFELPYNIQLPAADADCWCLHLDILGLVSEVIQKIQGCVCTPSERAYLAALIDLDAQTRSWIERILVGLNSTERYSA
jgi:hypothetical protein